jgi:hypothetical protein
MQQREHALLLLARRANAKDSTCTNLFDCCLTDLFGASCACYEQSVCDASSEELYPRVPSCPQT